MHSNAHYIRCVRVEYNKIYLMANGTVVLGSWCIVAAQIRCFFLNID